jgi:Flp pilus assembly pilin Flp
MKRLLGKFWNDDAGALIAAEYLFFSSIVVIGITVGMTAFRNAVVAEFEELANAYLAINFGYSFGGLSGCCSSVQGSQAIQTPQTIAPHVCTPPIPSVINVTACP